MTRESPNPSEAPVPAEVGSANSAAGHGALLRWFYLERELWWLALVGWRKRAPVRDGGSTFTHHQQANWTLVAGVLSALIVIEGTAVHFWLHSAGYTAAKWIALGVHVYLLAWIMGDAQALRLYTTRVVSRTNGGRVVTLRVGLRGRANIPVARVVLATTGTWDEAEPGGELVSVSGFANVSLTFDSPLEFVPMLGKPRMVKSLRVQIDDPERFIEAIGRRSR